jgi:hypothetical protein
MTRKTEKFSKASHPGNKGRKKGIFSFLWTLASER